LFHSQQLRAGFKEFIEFCSKSGIKLTIVSDGFSLYIRPILKKHNLDIPFHANTVELTEAGSLHVEFENARESCIKCGACKCAAIMSTSADEDTIVYIGDGYSDVCPIEISDIVFARDMLRRFCSEKGVPYHPFEDFYTIMDILQNYLVQRPKYKRKESLKNRNKLYILE
ncbi:MAG TPA: HAD-IB family phosphatase, partial [Candidatus Kapabacteria bacterium]|nr:HAD-IB family phosphatase [Candidatus Kapabacteria bacterium]